MMGYCLYNNYIDSVLSLWWLWISVVMVCVMVIEVNIEVRMLISSVILKLWIGFEFIVVSVSVVIRWVMLVFRMVV